MQCTHEGCSLGATYHLSYVKNRMSVREQHLCEHHARQTLSFGALPADMSRPPRVLENAKHFDFDMVIISEVNDSQVIYLREVAGDQRIPILIGIFEASLLDRAMKGLPSPRPLTHDAMAIIVRALGADVQDVLIDELEDHTYHAKVRILLGAKSIVVDIRPSDAFMLAIAFDAPIFFADGVLDQLE